jgi:K+-sensing histidine kinase KdpD
LTRLRELALREIAHALDRRRQQQAGDEKTQSTANRLTVWIGSRSPYSQSVLERLLRALPEVDVTIVGSRPAWRS